MKVFANELLLNSPPPSSSSSAVAMSRERERDTHTWREEGAEVDEE